MSKNNSAAKRPSKSAKPVKNAKGNDVNVIVSVLNSEHTEEI